MDELRYPAFLQSNAQLQGSFCGISVFTHDVKTRRMCTPRLMFHFAGSGCSFTESVIIADVFLKDCTLEVNR